jgi:DNA-binding GntR family transcriptional regulator
MTSMTDVAEQPEGGAPLIIQESLVELAADAVRQLVSSGNLGPGAKVNEAPLATRLGISRPPLREALRMLASEGLLEQSPRRGYRVVTLSTADLDEIHGLRRVLESYAVDLIAARATPLELDELDRILTEMGNAADRGDAARVVGGNLELHVAIIAAAGHKRLTESYRTLLYQLQVSIAANVLGEARSVGDLRQGHLRHARLVEALRVGDTDQLRAAFNDHGQRDYLGASELSTSQS